MATGNDRQCPAMPGNVPAMSRQCPAMSGNEASENTRQCPGCVRQDALIAGHCRGCPAMSGKPRRTPPYIRVSGKYYRTSGNAPGEHTPAMTRQCAQSSPDFRQCAQRTHPGNDPGNTPGHCRTSGNAPSEHTPAMTPAIRPLIAGTPAMRPVNTPLAISPLITGLPAMRPAGKHTPAMTRQCAAMGAATCPDCRKTHS